MDSQPTKPKTRSSSGNPSPPISEIGEGLVSHAKSIPKAHRLPLSTLLYPYIVTAYRKMTTREISDWLARTHGKKLSATMIAKTLNNRELHLRKIAEHVGDLASYISAFSQKYSVGTLLYQMGEGGKTAFRQYVDENRKIVEITLTSDAIAALDEFSELWDKIPTEVKYMCRPYFDPSLFPPPPRFSEETMDDTTAADPLPPPTDTTKEPHQ